MLNEVLLYTIAIIAVIFLMAPSNHPDSYTGKASAIEVEAQIITTEYDNEIEFNVSWIEFDEEIEQYSSEGVIQWVDEEIEDVWAGEVELMVMDKVEPKELPILMLCAAKEVSILPTKKGAQPKGFGKPKKGKTKKK
jgi:hypothetical protein